MSVNTTRILTAFSMQSEQSNIYHRARRFWSAALFLTGSLGIAAGVVGVVIGIEGVAGFANDRLAAWGTGLIAAMFPLLMLAAHCMDKIGEANRAIRLEYCRRHGMRDEER